PGARLPRQAPGISGGRRPRVLDHRPLRAHADGGAKPAQGAARAGHPRGRSLQDAAVTRLRTAAGPDFGGGGPLGPARVGTRVAARPTTAGCHFSRPVAGGRSLYGSVLVTIGVAGPRPRPFPGAGPMPSTPFRSERGAPMIASWLRRPPRRPARQ